MEKNTILASNKIVRKEKLYATDLAKQTLILLILGARMFIFKNLGLHMCFAPGLVQDGKMKACRSRMKFSIKFFCKMSYGYYYFCSGLSTYMNMIFTAKICLTQVQSHGKSWYKWSNQESVEKKYEMSLNRDMAGNKNVPIL